MTPAAGALLTQTFLRTGTPVLRGSSSSDKSVTQTPKSHRLADPMAIADHPTHYNHALKTQNMRFSNCRHWLGLQHIQACFPNPRSSSQRSPRPSDGTCVAVTHASTMSNLQGLKAVLVPGRHIVYCAAVVKKNRSRRFSQKGILMHGNTSELLCSESYFFGLCQQGRCCC